MVLASGSASRYQQLKDLGFHFKVEVPGINEDIYKTPYQKISLNHLKKAKLKADEMGEVAQTIAKAKVEKVALKYPKALVLGGDQMACLGTEIFNKPLTAEQAIQSLMKLQGQTHILWTALHIRYGEKSFSHLEANEMTMRALSEEQVKAYVKKAKPLQCAGAYALERYGIALFEKINTKDQSAVIGFPLITLINQLDYWGIPLPFLTLRPQGQKTKRRQKDV